MPFMHEKVKKHLIFNLMYFELVQKLHVNCTVIDTDMFTDITSLGNHYSNSKLISHCHIENISTSFGLFGIRRAIHKC